VKVLALHLAHAHAARVRCSLTFALTLSVLTVCTAARAYRPFDGTDADVAALGEFELELGPAHYLSTPTGRYVIAPATVLNLGFAPGFELVVDAKNYVGLTSVPGQQRDRLLDTDVFVKALLRRGALQDGTGLSVASEFGPLTPGVGGDSGFGAQVNVITSYEWPALAVHLNTSAALSRAHNFDGFVSLILEGPRDWTLRPVAEAYAEREVSVVTTFSGLIGAIWASSEHLAIDAAVRAAHQDIGASYEVRLGLTWTLPVWGHHDETDARQTSVSLHRGAATMTDRL
jgi:hypothetical protein